jgi:hypothetical protein
MVGDTEGQKEITREAFKDKVEDKEVLSSEASQLTQATTAIEWPRRILHDGKRFSKDDGNRPDQSI